MKNSKNIEKMNKKIFSIDTQSIVQDLQSGQLNFIDFIDNSLQYGQLQQLLEHPTLFDELFEQNVVDEDDIEYLYTNLFLIKDLQCFFAHPKLSVYAVQHNIAKCLDIFKNFDRLYGNIEDFDFDKTLCTLLSNNLFKLKDYEELRFRSKFKNEKILNFRESQTLPIYFLSQKIASFTEVLNLLKAHASAKELIENTEFFQYALKKKLLTKTDIKKLLNSLSFDYEWRSFFDNKSLLDFVVQHKLLATQELIELAKRKKMLKSLLSNSKLFEHAFKKKLFTESNIHEILDNLTEADEYKEFSTNDQLLIYVFENCIKTFHEVVELFKNHDALGNFLKNIKLLKALQAMKKFGATESQILLDAISRDSELFIAVNNLFFVEIVVENFLITKAHVEKFNKILKNQDFCEQYFLDEKQRNGDGVGFEPISENIEALIVDHAFRSLNLQQTYSDHDDDFDLGIDEVSSQFNRGFKRRSRFSYDADESTDNAIERRQKQFQEALKKSRKKYCRHMTFGYFDRALPTRNFFDFLRLSYERKYDPSTDSWKKREKHEFNDDLTKFLKKIDVLRVMHQFQTLSKDETKILFEYLLDKPTYLKKLKQVFDFNLEQTFDSAEKLIYWLEHVHIDESKPRRFFNSNVNQSRNLFQSNTND